MKEKKRPTEDYDLWQEEQTYQTGSTNPPKNYGGIIAFLLVLVIFLCGISTALGVLNIRLFRQLSAAETTEESCAVAFADAPSLKSSLDNSTLIHFSLGFTGQAVPDFWQHYRDIPQGIFVTEVDTDSIASASGILPGDVLLSIGGIPMTDTDTFCSVMEDYTSGDTLEVILNRSGTQVDLTITRD